MPIQKKIRRNRIIFFLKNRMNIWMFLYAYENIPQKGINFVVE